MEIFAQGGTAQPIAAGAVPAGAVPVGAVHGVAADRRGVGVGDVFGTRAFGEVASARAPPAPGVFALKSLRRLLGGAGREGAVASPAVRGGPLGARVLPGLPAGPVPAMTVHIAQPRASEPPLAWLLQPMGLALGAVATAEVMNATPTSSDYVQDLIVPI